MRQMCLALLATLPLGPCLVAQEAAVTAQDPKTEFDALSAEVDEAMAAFNKRLRAAYEKGGRKALRKMQQSGSPLADFVPRFSDAANKYTPTPEALPFLDWLIVRSGDATAGQAALFTLVTEYANNADIEPTVASLLRAHRVIGEPEVLDALAELRDASTQASVQGATYYVDAMIRINGDDKSALQGAVADLRKAIELAPNASFAAAADGFLFERDNLQVGQAAPDIVASDLDGVEFKLSDYKGKAVLLDFWGHW